MQSLYHYSERIPFLWHKTFVIHRTSQNIDLLHRLLPLGKSFDLITRDLRLGETPAFWLGINGFCNTEILQQIFSDLQDPHYTLDPEIRDLPRYVQSRLGYAQISLTSSVDDILQNLLSGPSILLVDGFDQAVIIDVRTIPSAVSPSRYRTEHPGCPGRLRGDTFIQYKSYPPPGAFCETDLLHLHPGNREPHRCSYCLSGRPG